MNYGLFRYQKIYPNDPFFKEKCHAMSQKPGGGTKSCDLFIKIKQLLEV